MVVKNKRYFAFKFGSRVTTVLDLQCLIIKHIIVLVMDENEYWPYMPQRRQEQWETCITRTGGDDYYQLDLPMTAAKFWNAFSLQEDIHPDDIQEQTLNSVIDDLCIMVWQSHVLSPP